MVLVVFFLALMFGFLEKEWSIISHASRVLMYPFTWKRIGLILCNRSWLGFELLPFLFEQQGGLSEILIDAIVSSRFHDSVLRNRRVYDAPDVPDYVTVGWQPGTSFEVFKSSPFNLKNRFAIYRTQHDCGWTFAIQPVRYAALVPQTALYWTSKQPYRVVRLDYWSIALNLLVNTNSMTK